MAVLVFIWIRAWSPLDLIKGCYKKLTKSWLKLDWSRGRETSVTIFTCRYKYAGITRIWTPKNVNTSSAKPFPTKDCFMAVFNTSFTREKSGTQIVNPWGQPCLNVETKNVHFLISINSPKLKNKLCFGFIDTN